MSLINQISSANTFSDWLITTQALVEHSNYFSSNVASVLAANAATQTANTNANIANTNANIANTNSWIASTNANTASNNANTASNNANTAATNANTASANANTAATNANTASANANTASANANTANTNAWTAVSVTISTILGIVYPVGSIYINSTDSTNPGTLLGFGTWTAFGSGRVPVGYNASDASFDAAEKTGGSKNAIIVSHTHTANSVVTDPGHAHSVASGGFNNNQYNDRTALGDYLDAAQTTTSNTTGITVATTVDSTGSSGTNANLPPYITVYMWKRTA